MRTADRLREARETLVASVVDEFYRRHPDWVERWDAAGRESFAQDVGFTLAYVEASLRSRDPSILVEYARWLGSILRSRHVPIDSAHESFDLLAAAVGRVLPEDEAARTADALRKAKAGLDDATAPQARPSERTPLAEEFLEALVAGDRAALQRILEQAVAGGLSMAQVADTIIQPVMTEIGARWARNEMSVADEHRATALAQLVLARLAPAPVSNAQGSAIIACVEGNLHSLGARVVADALEAEGWNVHFMGADVPTRDLVAYIRQHPVELVGLSVALPLHLPTAERVVAALRREFGPTCPRIVLGGKPIREFAGGAGFVEADAVFHDASSGVAGAR